LKVIKQEMSSSGETCNLSVEDFEAPPPMTKRTSSDSVSDDEDREILVVDFYDTNEVIYVPLPGQENTNDEEAVSTRRQVINGCAICLSTFTPEERITWSSNPDCAHIFHHDCVLHWFLTVGRKSQRNRRRMNPEMSETEALDMICKFPMLCPCCRQSFWIEKNEEKTTKPDEVRAQDDDSIDIEAVAPETEEPREQQDRDVESLEYSS
jgi:hypothetical protein